MPMQYRQYLLASATTSVLTAWSLWLFAAYLFHVGGVHRYNVETAALVAAACGIAVKSRLIVECEEAQCTDSNLLSLYLPFFVLSIALYWRSLFVGFLSDDYVLLDRASRWDIARVDAAMFRPLPLSIWAVACNVLGSGAFGIHFINLLLHGLNAALVTKLAAGWTGGTRVNWIAGFVFAVFPLDTEAVVWGSGVFDLSMTTLVLAAMLRGRRYCDPPPPRVRCAFFSLSIAAVACKETGVVVPVLTAIDAWVVGNRSRSLRKDLLIVAICFACFGLWRLQIGDGLTHAALSKYMLQRTLFGGIAAFIVPFHEEILARYPFVALSAVIAVSVLFARFWITSDCVHQLRRAFGATLLVLAPLLPVMKFFVVSPDLGGSRYIYLSSVGWALMIATVVAGSASRSQCSQRFVSAACVTSMMATYAFAVHIHLAPWIEAATLRDKLELQALERASWCSTVEVASPPDSVRGAYLFRNGIDIALRRDVGLVSDSTAQPGCILRWDAASSSFK